MGWSFSTGRADGLGVTTATGLADTVVEAEVGAALPVTTALPPAVGAVVVRDVGAVVVPDTGAALPVTTALPPAVGAVVVRDVGAVVVPDVGAVVVADVGAMEGDIMAPAVGRAVVTDTGAALPVTLPLPLTVGAILSPSEG